jgi:hypothetical protein
MRVIGRMYLIVDTRQSFLYRRKICTCVVCTYTVILHSQPKTKPLAAGCSGTGLIFSSGCVPMHVHRERVEEYSLILKRDVLVGSRLSKSFGRCKCTVVDVTIAYLVSCKPVAYLKYQEPWLDRYKMTTDQYWT